MLLVSLETAPVARLASSTGLIVREEILAVPLL
jgi:hypothetical protein